MLDDQNFNMETSKWFEFMWIKKLINKNLLSGVEDDAKECNFIEE